MSNHASQSDSANTTVRESRTPASSDLPFVSLFSGIGGMDAGLAEAGGVVTELCEYWEPARRVLRAHFPNVPLAMDVRDFTPSAEHMLIAAGFPCVDLSHAGRQAGIFGAQSGLVTQVFRIAAVTRPSWIALENVPNLLRLGRGAGIAFIIEQLEALGYDWAYRVLDSRGFGVPQRRHRVIVLASLERGAATAALLGTDTRLDASFDEPANGAASGFYWTEGRRGVGLVRNSVPTLKGGSTLGLPSAPAVWMPEAPVGSRIILPSIEDAEELQGLTRGWTSEADAEGEHSSRWKLVGNAVTKGIGTWVATRIQRANGGNLESILPKGTIRDERRPWPDAAFGGPGAPVHAVAASRWPELVSLRSLDQVLDRDHLHPLSYRATKGFLSRIEESGIALDESFLADLEGHMTFMRKALKPEQSWASSDDVRRRMQATKQKNTKPEVRLRRALSDRGMRYRLQVRVEPDLRWRSDIVFKGPKVVVDVRGCFWHACPVHRTSPKANAERWENKLRGNQERDARMESELTARGWVVVVVWEHESSELAAERIALIVDSRRQRKQASPTTLETIA